MCIGSESKLLNVYSYGFDFYSYLVFPNKRCMLGFFYQEEGKILVFS